MDIFLSVGCIQDVVTAFQAEVKAKELKPPDSIDKTIILPHRIRELLAAAALISDLM